MRKDLSTGRTGLICLMLVPVADRQRQLMLWHERVPIIIFLEVFAAHRNITVVATDLDLRTLRDGVAILIEPDHHGCLVATKTDRF